MNKGYIHPKELTSLDYHISRLSIILSYFQGFEAARRSSSSSAFTFTTNEPLNKLLSTLSLRSFVVNLTRGCVTNSPYQRHKEIIS
jgi:hypothetical protein